MIGAELNILLRRLHATREIERDTLRHEALSDLIPHIYIYGPVEQVRV